MEATQFHLHVNELPRVMPFPPTVRELGYLPEKRAWVRAEFSYIVFCFILGERGGCTTATGGMPLRRPAFLQGGPESTWSMGPHRRGHPGKSCS